MAEKPETIAYMLKNAIKDTNIPGIVGAVFRLERSTGKSYVVAKGAHGYRRSGHPEKMLENDLMRIGGCTMSFVATVVAMLVDQGKLRWSESIYNLLIESGVPVILDHYKFATLEMLLQHRAGLCTDIYPTKSKDLSSLLYGSTLNPTQQREQYVTRALRTEPAVHTGIYNFSHAGYIVAAYIAETATGTSFENLLRTMLLKPLNMEPYCLGPIPSSATNDVPSGHIQATDSNGQTEFVPFSDVNSICRGLHYNSAGGLCMNMESLAKYAMWHVQGDLGMLPPNSYPKQSTFLLLHNHFTGGSYAHGWVHHPEVPYLIFHDGMAEGFTTLMVGFLNYDVSVALSINAWHYDSKMNYDKTCQVQPLQILESLTWQLARRYTVQRVLPLPARLMASCSALKGGVSGVISSLARDLRGADEGDCDEPVLFGLTALEKELEEV